VSRPAPVPAEPPAAPEARIAVVHHAHVVPFLEADVERDHEVRMIRRLVLVAVILQLPLNGRADVFSPDLVVRDRVLRDSPLSLEVERIQRAEVVALVGVRGCGGRNRRDSGQEPDSDQQWSDAHAVAPPSARKGASTVPRGSFTSWNGGRHSGKGGDAMWP